MKNFHRFIFQQCLLNFRWNAGKSKIAGTENYNLNVCWNGTPSHEKYISIVRMWVPDEEKINGQKLSDIINQNTQTNIKDKDLTSNVTHTLEIFWEV